MAKKKELFRYNKKIPQIIEGGKFWGRIDYGNMFYRKAPIHLMMYMTDETLVFNYSFDKVGVGFDFRIEGKKEVAAFVELVNKIYEFNTKPQKRK
jgi:hypothetical protein